ncbi:hypothetical protein [Methanosphaerula palustris]|nr:hypothetical protein [Methanosphaerula palustris]
MICLMISQDSEILFTISSSERQPAAGPTATAVIETPVSMMM